MSDARVPEYVVDLTNHSNRLRLESAVPGRPMKVVVRAPAPPDGPALHGTGLLSADGRSFAIDIPTPSGLHHQTCDWAKLSAELNTYSEFD